MGVFTLKWSQIICPGEGWQGRRLLGRWVGVGRLGPRPLLRPRDQGLFSAVAAGLRQRLAIGAGGPAGKTGTGSGRTLASDPPRLRDRGGVLADRFPHPG